MEALALGTKEKEIISWRVVRIDYLYRGKNYQPDTTFTGEGRQLVQVDNPKNKLWLQPGMSYDKAGVEVKRICYPIFKK